jgi:hypothetical protein
MVDLSALESGPIDLLPEESASFVMAITSGTSVPIELVLRWLDSTGEHEREVRLTLP